jgi:hypothetical protein
MGELCLLSGFLDAKNFNYTGAMFGESPSAQARSPRYLHGRASAGSRFSTKS